MSVLVTQLKVSFGCEIKFVERRLDSSPGLRDIHMWDSSGHNDREHPTATAAGRGEGDGGRGDGERTGE